MSSGEPGCAVRLRAILDTETPKLLAFTEEAARTRPWPDHWSPVEIMGHLVDSAANNHQRFVRAADQNDLVFGGYVQDAWVSRQQYQAAPWREIVTLWDGYNRHLARVMGAVPAEVRDRVHLRHNLHLVAWRTVPEDTPTTLDYLMNDYVDHLEHHLFQVLA